MVIVAALLTKFYDQKVAPPSSLASKRMLCKLVIADQTTEKNNDWLKLPSIAWLWSVVLNGRIGIIPVFCKEPALS
eukprot:1327751-Amphidinium_carterae.1